MPNIKKKPTFPVNVVRKYRLRKLDETGHIQTGLSGVASHHLLNNKTTLIRREIEENNESNLYFNVTSIYPALNESNAVQFLFTTNQSDRTYYWTNGGTTTASDFVENLNAGSFATIGGTGSVTFTPIEDRFTEGSETILFQARNGSTGGTIIASSSLLVINDTSIGEYFVNSVGTQYPQPVLHPDRPGYITAYAEGVPVTFVVTTTANDDELYWTIEGGITAADLDGNVNSGSFMTTAGTGSVVLTAYADSLTEGNEKLIFQVRTNNYVGNVVASTELMIVDTSTNLYRLTASAIEVVEGSSISFTFTTSGPDGTFNWDVAGAPVPNSQASYPSPDASDFVGNVSSGSFVVTSGTGSFTLNVLNDSVVESERFRVRVLSGSIPLATSETVRIDDYYSIIPSAGSVNEGGSITFTFTTRGSDDTFYWENDGTTNASDFVGTALSGSFITTAGTGSLVLSLRNDLLTEGVENIRISVRSGSNNGTLLVRSAYVTVNDTSAYQYVVTSSATSINEGSSVTFTFTTTDPTNTFSWDISAVTIPGTTLTYAYPEASDFVENISSGSFVMTNGTGSLTLNLLEDTITEGEERFRIRVLSGSTAVATSETITINDTSLNTYSINATDSINEGSPITFTVTTFSTDGTYYWTNGGTTTANDFVENINNGSFVIASGTGSVTLTAKNDITTEGTETIVFQLRSGSVAGNILATKLVNINDTSETLYTMTPSTLSVVEGSTVTFTFTTSGPDGTFNWDLVSVPLGQSSYPYPVASDFVENVSSGSFVTTAGTGSLTLTLNIDGTAEDEQFRIRVLSGSTSLVISPAILIGDYYKLVPSATSVNEGSSITFTFTTRGTDGTYYWTNAGTSIASDFVDNVTSGSFVVTAGTGSVTLTARNDITTEGTETIIFQVRSGSYGGNVLSSRTVDINDTSTYQYTIVASTSSIDEGFPVTFTFTTSGPDGAYYWNIASVPLGQSSYPYPDAADFVENVSSGSFVVTSGTGSVTLNLSADNLGEEEERFRLLVRSGSFGGTTVATSEAITINNTSGIIAIITGSGPETIVFRLATSTQTLYEGSSVTFTFTTTGPDGTFNWNTVGALLPNSLDDYYPSPEASDFVENVSSGSFVTTSGTGSLTLTRKNDLEIQDTERFTLRIISGSASISSPVVIIYDTYSYTISGTGSVNTVNENTSFSVELRSNITDGVYYWENTGTTAGIDFINGFNTGSFTMTNGTGSINLSTKPDLLTEGTETIILQIKSGSMQEVVAIVPTIYVTDSSTTQYVLSASTTTVNEGSPVTFTFTTTGPNGTFYWDNAGTTTASDFVENINSGSFVTTSGTGSIVFNVKADLLTDGTETIDLRIRTGSPSGSIVASGSLVTVSDSSQTQYTVTSDRLSVDEGSPITFTITTTGTDGTLYWTNGGTSTANDFVGNTNSGSFVTTSGTGSLTLTVASDALTENETFILQVREGSLTGPVVASSFAISIIDDTWALSASSASVNEGSTVTFTLTTTDTDKTYYWTNDGTSTGADFSDGLMSGSFVTTSGTGSFTRTLVNDLLTEGTETILMNVRTGSYTGNIVASASVNINDTSLTQYTLSASEASINEGSTVTFMFTTSGPNGTFYWTNSGTSTGADFSDNANSGSFITTSGTGSFTRTLANDIITEGTETIIINVRTESFSGTIVASSSVDINDTSTYQYALSPSVASVNEGSSVTFTFTTNDPSYAGTTLYWTNNGTSVIGDFTDNTNSGSFVTTSGTGSFTRTLVNDLITEGAETIAMNVRNGSFSGGILASTVIDINDTSQAAVNIISLTDPNNTTTTYTVADLSGSISLTTTGSYTMTALTNFSASAKMWGGAGGAYGGSGGFTNGTIGFVSGNNYVIWIGGGGVTTNRNVSGVSGAFGGGGFAPAIGSYGSPNNSDYNIGSGGGLTGLFRTSATQANAILIAGGGGGGGLANGFGITNATRSRGGNGGGSSGLAGYDTDSGINGAIAGLGGTQLAGGTSGYGAAGNGSALTGGPGGSTGGGGGGGGYFGGGGGGGNNPSGESGGGGSGFVSPTLAITGSTEAHATRGTVPQTTDVHYIAGRAAPSNSTTSETTSGAGLFVLTPAPTNIFTLTDPNNTTTTYTNANLNSSISLTTTGSYTMTALTDFTGSAKIWGGAGGSYGGSGGFTNGTIGFVSGNNYVIWVGGGGRTTNININGYDGGFGGGGLVGRTNSTNTAFSPGSGGGLSGIFLNSAAHANSILIAGGGGGAGGGSSPGSSIAIGGNGGGLTAQSAADTANAAGVGAGGTQSAGGASGSFGSQNAGATSGSALQGGLGAATTGSLYTGGGGGSGYYGGGGGGTNNTSGEGGGGGAGFVSTTLAITGSTEIHATRGTVPQTNNTHYITGRAAPSNSTTAGTTSGAGLFVFVSSL